jgi:ribonuclease T1
MNRQTYRKATLIGWALVALVALLIGQAWLPAALSPAGGNATTADLRQAPDEEQRAIQTVVALIEAGGPFPYAKDGSEFFNREGRLPPNGPGYYREYTVETPGSSDRGARRIVAGRNGEFYYTRDHYQSFIRLE